MNQLFQKKLSILPVSKMEDLKEGDHIVVKGKIENLHPSLKQLHFIAKKDYFHHGIYIGDNEVIDFGGNSKSEAKPRKIDILQFLSSSSDCKLYRVNDDTGSKSESCVASILTRAYTMVEDPSKWPEYNMFWNNCESFVNYLKYGEAFTEQGKNALHFSLALLGGASSVVALSVLSGKVASQQLTNSGA